MITRWQVEPYSPSQHLSSRDRPVTINHVAEHVRVVTEPQQLLSKNTAKSSQPESAVEQLHESDVSVFACGECGGLLESYFGASRRIVCQECGASTDINGTTKDPMLNAAAQAFDHSFATRRAEFGLGSRIQHANMPWRVIGVQQFSGTLTFCFVNRIMKTENTKDFKSNYTLWWLLNERREIAWIGERAVGGVSGSTRRYLMARPCRKHLRSITTRANGPWSML